MKVRAIFWTGAMAYTGFLLTGQGLRTFNSLSVTEGFLGALTGFLLAIMITLRGGAPTKTFFDCTFHRTNPAELGHSHRKPRIRSEAKALIQTGRLETGDFRKPLLYPTELRGPSFSQFTTAACLERFHCTERF